MQNLKTIEQLEATENGFEKSETDSDSSDGKTKILAILRSPQLLNKDKIRDAVNGYRFVGPRSTRRTSFNT